MKFAKEFFDFQEELALNSDLTSIGKTVLKHAVQATGGQAGLFLYLAPGAKYFQLVAAQGYSDSSVGEWQKCTPDRDLPLPLAISSGQSLFVASKAEIIQTTGEKATAALPIGETGFCFAGYAVSYHKTSEIPPDEQAFLNLVAHHARTALEQLSGEGGV